MLPLVQFYVRDGGIKQVCTEGGRGLGTFRAHFKQFSRGAKVGLWRTSLITSGPFSRKFTRYVEFDTQLIMSNHSGESCRMDCRRVYVQNGIGVGVNYRTSIKYSTHIARAL